ncbi:Tn3 family transposase [Streptomyces sp. WAC05858]|uniref:Tn3 family transposase n=1 Tax=Streptomyces TaxID=1883 RepID=UPI000F7880B6|nr:Tn3 family transposase [Streptomyces sp. WAC05858]RSS47604.1 hypothetical protein EF902_09140 [Streptomyces sp. WAC05858]WTB04041.1 Tn3 family transposase [Streptomyces antimycoticus]
MAPRKVTDFAGEADAADASELKAYVPVKRVALVACLAHKARMRVRDELALMFCKRVGAKTKKAKEELEALRLAEREMTEALIGNYRTATFVKGTNMNPYEAARHIPGVSGHELAYVANRHFSLVLLNEAIADLVNAHARLDISQAWGDGTAAAADGTHMDTYLDNLLAETSVRYGTGVGAGSPEFSLAA